MSIRPTYITNTCVVDQFNHKSAFTVWNEGWLDISKKEYEMFNAINNRIIADNKRVMATEAHQKEQRRLRYDELKKEFEPVKQEEAKP